MGLIPFTCIPKQNDLHHFVRVVFPDGRIETLSRSCSVHEILHGNPDYFVCGSSAQTLTSRMGTHEQLEKGFTYFVCCQPNAPPFLEFPAKGPGPRAALATGWKMSPRFFGNGMQAKENRSSPTHHSNSKVFDFHSAAIQVEGMKVGLLHQQRLHHLATPKHLRLVFFRECLQSLRLPRTISEILQPPLPSDESPPASPSPDETELVNALLQSAARSELGVQVAKRQEISLRRSRKRRKAPWKPWLQSIPETSTVVEFLLPVPPQQPQPEPESKRFSPPRATRNISPPRQRGPPRNISPPRQVHVTPQLPRTSSLPRQQPQPQLQPQRQRQPNKALYMA